MLYRKILQNYIEFSTKIFEKYISKFIKQIYRNVDENAESLKALKRWKTF